MSAWRAVALGGLVLAGTSGSLQAQAFDHPRHARLFTVCAGCHAGAQEPEQSIWPSPETCASCHDGTVRPRVTWRPPPPEAARPSNLKFVHDLVPIMIGEGQTELPKCVDCHQEPGAPWMTVRRAIAKPCLDCHGVRTAHWEAPDSVCSTCHVPLVQATSFSRADVARLPVPPSHGAADWVSRGGGGHGAAAQRGGAGEAVAASCATCHARDFCLACHVDGPEQAAVQALEPDERSTAIAVRLRPPQSHQQPRFLAEHGPRARRAPQDCRTCHTQESCLTCHVGTPSVAESLYAKGPGRGAGAVTHRRPPVSHVARFRERHAGTAASRPQTCAGCHVRPDCLQCHRPSAASAPRYHAAGFLARHPAAAYARETSCADCHNVGAFCSTCHASAGLAARRPLTSRYHDAQPFFVAGHGGAARRSLETCVGCHTERDCLTCHSAVGGRSFKPHGPGFDAERLRRKNPEMCTACHGSAIPGG